MGSLAFAAVLTLAVMAFAGAVGTAGVTHAEAAATPQVSIDWP
ncbi:hypothetical protein OIB37_29590 [Streptomyces sp. NBC_00820]|nr:hypothetical protein OIB37_29590 [Streptomyces sp. NBC_00820]